jgi:hypothetical protein
MAEVLDRITSTSRTSCAPRRRHGLLDELASGEVSIDKLVVSKARGEMNPSVLPRRSRLACARA